MHRRMSAVLLAFALLPALRSTPAQAPTTPVTNPSHAEIAPADRIEPNDLADSIQKSASPLILQVGPRTFFDQAHILGAEYVGAASTDAGMDALRARVASVSKNRWIVLYCGCCPWDRCPNIRPAFNALHELGFTHVQALNLPSNFGADWVDKGFPIEK